MIINQENILPKFIHRHTEELLGETKLEKVDSEGRIVADVKGRKSFKKQLNKKSTWHVLLVFSIC